MKHIVTVTEVKGYPKKKFLEAVRCSYGKKNTPQELREYKVSPMSPVGTQSEYFKYINDNTNYDGIIFVAPIADSTEVYSKDGEFLTTL